MITEDGRVDNWSASGRAEDAPHRENDQEDRSVKDGIPGTRHDVHLEEGIKSVLES